MAVPRKKKKTAPPLDLTTIVLLKPEGLKSTDEPPADFIKVLRNIISTLDEQGKRREAETH